MSKSSDTKKEKTILSNALLTDITSSIFEKLYTLNEKVQIDTKNIAGILKIHQDKQDALARIVELQDEYLNININQYKRDIHVLRARVSLLEGRVKSLPSEQISSSKPTSESKENLFAPSKDVERASNQ